MNSNNGIEADFHSIAELISEGLKVLGGNRDGQSVSMKRENGRYIAYCPNEAKRIAIKITTGFKCDSKNKAKSHDRRMVSCEIYSLENGKRIGYFPRTRDGENIESILALRLYLSKNLILVAKKCQHCGSGMFLVKERVGKQDRLGWKCILRQKRQCHRYIRWFESNERLLERVLLDQLILSDPV